MDRPNRRQQVNKLRQKEILDELRQKRNKLNEKRHIEPEEGDIVNSNTLIKRASGKRRKGEPESLGDKACLVPSAKVEEGKRLSNLIRHSREIVESMNCREAGFYTKYFADDDDEISEISLM